ncbi:maleylpyruvate isomerase N-terminal domain-containing protein [Amnibacterium flavum]|nr:maleylpyruvate isomerase N-terminal domain-containing protein [Amnibacterium flavum]
MKNAPELERVSLAFSEAAARTDPTARIASRIWPTAGEMVDHLGTIQRWAAEVLRTGRTVDEARHERPTGRDRVEWFVEGAEALVREIDSADPTSRCWTFVGPGTNAFWGRRMVHEATKHLWDIRTAVVPDPPMPAEIEPTTAAAIIDEFDEVFIARARRNGIAPLQGSVLLQATDSDRSWLVEPDWTVRRDAAGEDSSAALRASTADLALMLWERADPWLLGHRFDRSGDEHVLHMLCETPVHL